MQTGDIAPDFESVDHEGNSVTLAGYLAEVGALRVGISADSIERQAAFAESGGLDYPLLSDTDRTIAKAFGVKRIGPVPNRRSTFVIDTDRTILDVISSETNMEVHADRALETLRNR